MILQDILSYFFSLIFIHFSFHKNQVFIFHNFEYTPQLKIRYILRRAHTFFRYTHDRRYSTRRCLSLIYTVFCFRFLFVSTAKPMHWPYDICFLTCHKVNPSARFSYWYSVSFVLPFMLCVQTVSGTFSRDFSQHSDIGSSDVHWRSSIVLFWCQSEWFLRRIWHSLCWCRWRGLR